MNFAKPSLLGATVVSLSTLVGELLYGTHCVARHTTQMHWRNDWQAFDWDSLKFQVREWRGNAGLAWNDADIAEVSR
jgi:hypothetical protein